MDRKRNDFAAKDGLTFKEDENALGMNPEEQALWEKTQSIEDRNAVMAQRDARRLREHKETEKRNWEKTHAGQLLRKLGECFMEYKDCMAKDPQLQQKALECDEINQKIFDRMKTNIERAHSAPRCRFEKASGQPCKAPRVRGKKYCHMHMMLEEARPRKIKLPGLGDANAIQAAIAKGAQAVVDGELDQKQAGILGYYLQLALSNIGRVNFEEPEGHTAETGH